jgi:O-antigen/teichoic acid export membrane protein
MSRLAKNVLYNLVGQCSLLILGFVAVRYIFRGLGEDALGIIYFALTASTVLSGMLDMGIGSSAVREISSHAASEPEYVTELIRTGSLFFWGAYLLCTLGVLLGAPAIANHWIKLKTLDPQIAILVLRVMGCASLVALPRTLYVCILRGLQRMEFNNLIDVASTGFQQFGTIVILLLGGGLLSIVYWFAICFFASIVAYAVVCVQFFPWRALVPGLSPSVVRRNRQFASSMAATSFLSVVESQADKAVVSKMLPIRMFGYYGVAYAAVSKGTLITSAIAQAALPSLCELHRLGDRKSLLSQYKKLQDFLCFVTVPIFAAIPFLAIPVFRFVLNDDAAHLLLLPTILLCLGFYLNGSLHPPHVFSLAVGRPDISARFNFYALFVVPPAAIVLVHFWGLNGAGFSWVIYNLFSYAYSIPRICNECGLGISPFDWYMHVFRFLGPAALIYGLAWTLSRTAGHGSIWASIGGYVLASGMFVCGSFVLIGSDLRTSFQGLIRSLRTKYAEVF